MATSTSTVATAVGPRDKQVPFKDFFKIICAEHDNVRDFKERFNKAFEAKDKEEMTRIANSTVKSAALHSDSEEVSVYKALEKHGFDHQAQKDREDHHKVKELMSQLEHTSVKDGLEKMHAIYNKAVDLFIEHAEQEESSNETGSLQQLRAKVSDEEADHLGEQFLTARHLVPERPHPEAPQTGGTLQHAAGAMARMFDKTLTVGRDYAKPKHDFPPIVEV